MMTMMAIPGERYNVFYIHTSPAEVHTDKICCSQSAYKVPM